MQRINEPLSGVVCVDEEGPGGLPAPLANATVHNERTNSFVRPTSGLREAMTTSVELRPQVSTVDFTKDSVKVARASPYDTLWLTLKRVWWKHQSDTVQYIGKMMQQFAKMYGCHILALQRDHTLILLEP